MQGALAVDGIVYRLQEGYVTACFVGEPPQVRQQHARAVKQILRTSRKVPILAEE